MLKAPTPVVRYKYFRSDEASQHRRLPVYIERNQCVERRETLEMLHDTYVAVSLVERVNPATESSHFCQTAFEALFR